MSGWSAHLVINTTVGCSRQKCRATIKVGSTSAADGVELRRKVEAQLTQKGWRGDWLNGTAYCPKHRSKA